MGGGADASRESVDATCRKILRLKYKGGATERVIARSIGIARSTVALTLERAAAAKLSWPLPATLTDRVLEAMLYANAGVRQAGVAKPSRIGRMSIASCAVLASR